MSDRIVIEDAHLAERLESIARHEQRSVREVLTSMIRQYEAESRPSDPPETTVSAREVRLAAYRRARDYWRQTGNEERAALSDEELDEQFWLFDAAGVPHLKEDKDEVELPASSLHRAGRALHEAGFRSERSDISSRSRDILDAEFTDYLLSRLERPVNDDNPSTD